MMDQVLAKTTQQLAQEINREHEQVETLSHNTIAHAIKAGQLLLEAKEKIDHGHWLAWVARNFAGSERTSQVYMRLANPKHAADLTDPVSVRGGLRLLSAGEPKERDRPIEPKDESTRNMLGNLNGAAIIDATVVEEAPSWMPERVQRKWHTCLERTAEITQQIGVSDEQSEDSVSSAFREAAKRARSLAVELEGLAEAVERRAA